MRMILMDIVFLVSLLLIANKIRQTWNYLFPKGFAEWRAERKRLKEELAPPEE